MFISFYVKAFLFIDQGTDLKKQYENKTNNL